MRSYLIFFLSPNLCTRFLKNNRTDFDYGFINAETQSDFYILLFICCCHFWSCFTADFVIYYVMFCVELISDIIKDMTIKFIRPIDIVLSCAVLSCLTPVESFIRALLGTKKIGTNFESKFPCGLICIFVIS